jgi:hypothetical protein
MPTRYRTDDPLRRFRVIRRLVLLIPAFLRPSFVAGLDRLLDVLPPFPTGGLPQSHGLAIQAEGPNSALFQERVAAAMDLLAVYSPVHVRWLTASYRLLCIWPESQFYPDALLHNRARQYLHLRPKIVWTLSSAELATHLVYEAAWARLARTGLRGALKDRVRRRLGLEAINCARRLPDAAAVEARWRQWLAESHTESA